MDILIVLGMPMKMDAHPMKMNIDRNSIMNIDVIIVNILVIDYYVIVFGCPKYIGNISFQGFSKKHDNVAIS